MSISFQNALISSFCCPLLFGCRVLCAVAFLFVPLLSAQAETLEQLIDEAVASHPLVQSQLSQSKAAQVGIDSARWQFYPTPSIAVQQAATSSTDPSFQGDDRVVIIGLRQPLWTGGRLTASLDSAKSTAEASRASVENVQQEIALRVIQDYGEWLSAYLQRQAWEESLAVHLRLQKQVKRRVDEGVSASSDLALAYGRLQSTRADVATVEAQEIVALSRLEQLIGRSLQSQALADQRAEPKLFRHDVSELQRLAQSLNPVVKQALAQVDVSDAHIDERQAALYPDVSLRLEHQQGNFNFKDADDENRIFIEFTSSFGAGFSNFSDVSEAQQIRQGALAQVAAQRRAVDGQVISDYALISSFELRVVALQSSLKIAHDVSESYGRQFLAGRKTWLDVMNAARDLVGIQVQLADAQSSRLTVSWRLAVFTEGLPSLFMSNR